MLYRFFRLHNFLFSNSDVYKRQELDTLDDDYEHQYDTGKLSAAKYKEIERRIDALEDKLDFAEDTLENKFGIDD